MARRAATEPKIGFNSVVLAASLAMFRPSMAVFNKERAPSRPIGRWDLSVMVEMWVATRKRWGVEAVMKGQNPYHDGRPPWYRASYSGIHSVENLSDRFHRCHEFGDECG